MGDVVSGQAFHGLTEFTGLEGINEWTEQFDLLLRNDHVIAFLEERHKIETKLVSGRMQSEGNIRFSGLDQAGAFGMGMGGLLISSDPSAWDSESL